jgi:hypothetical protein
VNQTATRRRFFGAGWLRMCTQMLSLRRQEARTGTAHHPARLAGLPGMAPPVLRLCVLAAPTSGGVSGLRDGDGRRSGGVAFEDRRRAAAHGSFGAGRRRAFRLLQSKGEHGADHGGQRLLPAGRQRFQAAKQGVVGDQDGVAHQRTHVISTPVRTGAQE